MSRLLRWVLGSVLLAGLVGVLILVVPFQSWLPGGTVADLPKGEVVNGTAFNRLFPAPGPGEQLVFTQEKRGFSEARLKQGEQTKALLAISDTITAPTSRDKFTASSEKIAGWPLVEQGPQASALLVAERFQVKVIGQGAGLDATQRHELIGAFQLNGLAALAPAEKKATQRRPALAPGRQDPVQIPVPSSTPAKEPAA
jgi:hypothetical protein